MVNAGTANVGSIVNMLKKVGAASVISSDPDAVRKADRLILPGVGNFDANAAGLHENGLPDALREAVLDRAVPFLGICLGMQLLCKGSEEGQLPGMGWIDADVVRFPRETAEGPLRVPHMGWNRMRVVREHAVLKELGDSPRFYFVHSYYVRAHVTSDVLGLCGYGVEFACAVARENLLAVQFHPEKSHKYGMRLMSNFVGWAP